LPATPESTPSEADASRAARQKTPPANRRDAAAGKSTDENETSGDGPGHAPAQRTPLEADEGKLVPLGRVNASAWESRMVRDVLLPTLPVPEGEDDALAAMHEKLRRERDAQMLQTFRQPVITGGFAFEFPLGEPGASQAPRWRDASGAEVAGASVRGTHAELAWAGAHPPRNIDYVLREADGRELARVSTDQAGTPSVKVRPAVRAWYWTGIEHAPTDVALGTSSPAAPRLEWRLLSGEAIPATWLRDDQWNRGRGQRIDLPLDAVARGARHALALVDPLTGWALACEIALR
jgi:hypothetical protein